MFFKNFKNSASLFTEISQVSWEFISQLKTLSSSLNAFENHSQRTCFSVKTVHISFKRPVLRLWCCGTFRKSMSGYLQENRKEAIRVKGSFLSLLCCNYLRAWFEIHYCWKTDPFFFCYSRAGRVWENWYLPVCLCEEGYWRLSWKILQNSCFEDTIRAQAVRAPGLSRTGAREEFPTEARAESSSVLGQHFLACYQHPALSDGSEEGKGRCCLPSIQELEPDPMCTLYASSVLSVHSVRQTKSYILLKFLLFIFTVIITSDKHRDYSFSSAWVLWNL